MAGVTAGKIIHKLRVVNVPWTVADVQLKQYFSQFGFIDNVKVIFDKSTGMSKNYGFVEISDKNTFLGIINKQSHQLEGHHMHVRNYFEN